MGPDDNRDHPEIKTFWTTTAAPPSFSCELKVKHIIDRQFHANELTVPFPRIVSSHFEIVWEKQTFNSSGFSLCGLV